MTWYVYFNDKQVAWFSSHELAILYMKERTDLGLTGFSIKGLKV